VLFDAGFTLTFPHPDVIARHAVDAGVIVDAKALALAVDEARRELARYPWAATPAQQTTRPKTAGADFFRRMLVLAGATGDDARLDHAATVLWDRHLENNIWCRVGDGVEAALVRLRAAGMRLGVISNSEGTIEAMLTSVGLRRHFDAIVDSWLVGVAKPDPAIFRIALDRLGVPAAEAVMVGDVPSIDIDGARAAGVRAVLVDPLDLHPTVDVPRVPDVAALAELLLGSAPPA
jgi:putative hydrolase of the HAD superfamily